MEILVLSALEMLGTTYLLCKCESEAQTLKASLVEEKCWNQVILKMYFSFTL